MNKLLRQYLGQLIEQMKTVRQVDTRFTPERRWVTRTLGNVELSRRYEKGKTKPEVTNVSFLKGGKPYASATAEHGKSISKSSGVSRHGSSKLTGSATDISRIDVNKDYRSKGLGTRLARHMLKVGRRTGDKYGTMLDVSAQKAWRKFAEKEKEPDPDIKTSLRKALQRTEPKMKEIQKAAINKAIERHRKKLAKKGD